MLLHGFVIIDAWISRSFLHEFVQWIRQSCSIHFFPLLNKTKLEFDQDFKAYRSFFFELKVLNELKFSMPWVRCAFANVLNWGLCSFLLLYQGDIYWRSSKYWGHFRIKTYVRIIPFFIDIVNIVIIVSCSWMLEGLSLMTVISPASSSQRGEVQYL